MKRIKNFLSDETGAELAEYAVAIALIVIVALAIYTALGTGLKAANSETASEIQNATITIP